LTIKETFDVYIQAIQNSDLKGLFTAVTEDDKFFFLTSGGKLIDSRQGYCKFHEDWFAEEGMWNVLADVCTPIRRSFAEANPDIRYTPEQYILR
jgi:ketosteroid isomerase-like protein